MKALTRNWKAVLAVLLLIAALLVWFLAYRPAKTEFESKQANLTNELMLLQMQVASTQAYNEEVIRENKKYEPLIDALPDEIAKLERSEKELFAKFPAEIREEDQIMYVLYLEQLFGTEITFKFGSADLVTFLSDGAAIGGLTLTVNYETTYQGFKDMITYLATDSRITSIRNSTLSYDHENDRAVGDLTLLCYLLQPDGYSPSEYIEPPVETPEETGKPNIFH